MATITQLEYVLAVEKFGHFAKAAHACHISQPTLSQQVLKVEEELGIVIFDRMRKPIRLTEAGRSFVDQARVVLREHQKLLYVARHQNQQLSGDFRLALIPTVASSLMPFFLEGFARSFPQVSLYLEELKTSTILVDLKENRLDGAILASPLPEAELNVEPLYYEELFLYLAPHHPLTQEEVIDPLTLDASQMWMLQDGHCFRNQVATLCDLHAINSKVFPNVYFQSGSLDALCQIVKRSHGYTLIPSLMLEFMSEQDRFHQVRPFCDPVPVREISFVTRRHHWKADIVQALQDSIRRSLPDAMRREAGPQLNILEIC